jgi:hypothetical protein
MTRCCYVDHCLSLRVCAIAILVRAMREFSNRHRAVPLDDTYKYCVKLISKGTTSDSRCLRRYFHCFAAAAIWQQLRPFAAEFAAAASG